MVEDRVSSGKRVAQLLASELTGLETGPLAGVEVVDAEPDVSPDPDGAEAYGIEYRGTRVGTTVVYPERVRVRLTVSADPGDQAVPVETSDEGLDLWIEDGVAVKRAVDTIRTVLENAQDS